MVIAFDFSVPCASGLRQKLLSLQFGYFDAKRYPKTYQKYTFPTDISVIETLTALQVGSPVSFEVGLGWFFELPAKG